MLTVNIPRWLRQGCVNLIVWAWPVMPRRLKVWAFLNDDLPPEENC